MLGRGIETLFKWIETLSRTVQKKLGNGIETVHGVVQCTCGGKKMDEFYSFLWGDDYIFL